MSEKKRIEVISETTFLDTDEAYAKIDGYLVKVINFRIIDPWLMNRYLDAFLANPDRDEFVMWESWQKRLQRKEELRRQWMELIKKLLGVETEGGSITQDVGEIFTAVFFEEVNKYESTESVG